MEKKKQTFDVMVFCGGSVFDISPWTWREELLEKAKQGLRMAIRELKQKHFNIFGWIDKLPALILVNHKEGVRFFFKGQKQRVSQVREVTTFLGISGLVDRFGHIGQYNKAWQKINNNFKIKA